MHLHSTSTTQPISSPTGEIIHELMGQAAGGTQQHSLAQITLPPGAGAARHYHPVAEESYYILAGAGTVTIDGDTIVMHPGDAVAIPAGSIHEIRNEGEAELVFLAVCAPPWTPTCSVFLD